MKTLKLSVVILVLAMVCRTQAATTYYATNSGPWTTTTTWSPNGPPVSGDTAYVTNGYAVRISGEAEQIVAGTLYLGVNNKGSGTLIVSNNASFTASPIIGVEASPNAYGFLTIADGAVVTNGSFMYLYGEAAERQGTVVRVNNGRLYPRTLYFSDSGSQLIITNGGSVETANTTTFTSDGGSNVLYIGGNNGSALASWNGGSSRFDIGGTNNGVIVDQGGSFTARFWLGANGNNCYVSITNGGYLQNGGNNIYIGYAGNGSGNRLIVSGRDSKGNASTFNSGGQNLTIGYTNATSGNCLLIGNGGVVSNILNSATGLIVGRWGESSNNYVSITSGGLLESVYGIQVGAAIGGNNAGNVVTNGPGGILQFTKAAPTITVNNPNLTLSQGNAFIITNGTVSFKGISVSLTNNWAGSLAPSNNITWLGANTLRLDGASGSASGAYTFYNNNGPTNYAGLELFNSANLVSAQAVTIGDSAHSYGGSLVVSNGTFSIRGVLTNYSPNVNLATVTSLVASNGIVWGDGSAATTTPGKVTFDVITTNQLASGTVAWHQLASATQQVDGVILGAGGLRKSGPGVLILAGNNKYAGTTVSNGTLQVSGVITGSVAVASNATLNVSGSVTGAVSVAAGGILSGTGALVGAVTNFGTFIVVVTNATPATNNITGSLTLQAGSQLVLTGESTNYLANNSSSTLTIIHASGGLNGTTFTTDNVPEGWRLSYDNVGGYVRLQPGYPGTMILFQ